MKTHTHHNCAVMSGALLKCESSLTGQGVMSGVLLKCESSLTGQGVMSGVYH